MQLIECVPNFSEGNDIVIIKQITDEIEKINLEKIVKITTLCIHTAQKTANLEGRLPFTSMPGDELQE